MAPRHRLPRDPRLPLHLRHVSFCFLLLNPPLKKNPLTLTKVKTSTKSAFSSLISFFKTLISLLTINPFAKLTTDGLEAPMPSWTLGVCREAGFVLLARGAVAGEDERAGEREAIREELHRPFTHLSCLLIVPDADSAVGRYLELAPAGGAEVFQ